MRTLFWILVTLLLLVRVPSLVQPAGGDQGLYAYVGERILAGDVPFRDAWDQKPPGIHYTYALMFAIRPDLSVVPAADLIVSALTALVLLALGRRLGPPGAGELAALLFLLYTNPALARLGGARIRAQCEVFIGLFAAVGFLLLHYASVRYARGIGYVSVRAAKGVGYVDVPRRGTSGALILAVAAGLCFGLAFAYKYNAGIYLLVGLAATLLWTRRSSVDAEDTRARRTRGVPSPEAWAAAPYDPSEFAPEATSYAPEVESPAAPPDPVDALAPSLVTIEDEPSALDEFPSEKDVAKRAIHREPRWDAPRSTPAQAQAPASGTRHRPVRIADLFPLALWLIVGFAAIVALLVGYFAAVGALRDLYDATIAYNVFYSGETYASRLDVLRYLVTFPARHARVEALWFLGGLGCVVLLVASWRRPAWLMPALWVAAACVSIAVNGSRGLPQYFLQAGPALALAAGMAGIIVWRRTGPILRTVIIVILAVCAWRVQDFGKAVDYTAYDLSYWNGTISRDQYLSRFGGRASEDKYSALAVDELARYLQANVPAQEYVLHFGFSQGALAQSHRVSATRFFWSRPIIAGFKEGTPGYGVAGLLSDIERTRPYEVVLQRRDWDPDTSDSANFFLRQPALAEWLRAHYQPARELGNFLLYRRVDAPAATPPPAPDPPPAPPQ